MQTEVRESTSQKVERTLKEQGRSKVWLAKQLDMSVATLYNRLGDNAWSIPELMMLQSLLSLK